MKKFYESPSVEIEKFTINDILTISGYDPGIEEGGDGGDIEF